MKRKLTIVVIILVSIIAVCVYFLATPRASVRADAITVLNYKTVGADQPGVWRIEVVFTNCTAKKISVALPFAIARQRPMGRRLRPVRSGTRL